MSGVKYINAYRLQYWLYAILNKKFGKMISFERDSLHSRYEVNRHNFQVYGVPHSIVCLELSKILINAGYIKEKGIMGDTFKKEVLRGKKVEKHYVTLTLLKSIGKSDVVLGVSPSVYYS